MSRREDRRQARQAENLFKAVAGLLLLISLGIGGITHFVPVLMTLIFGLLGLAVVGGLGYIGYRIYKAKAKGGSFSSPPVSSSVLNVTPGYRVAPVPVPAQPVWPRQRIREELGEIDWYQFEKFCAALLRSEGYQVERKGGAQPDGGVDLVATKNGESTLVQCKHWRTWTVQEKVIRELLGSMTHYKVQHGALYTLKGATRPAEAFARQHYIEIFNGESLAARAKAKLSDDDLTEVLSSRNPRCPRCEASMVWRTGDFDPFWGCSTFPRCRGILKHSGAR